MFLFVLLAVVAVAAALGMILARNSIHSALFLVVTLFCLAVLYLTLSAEFLAVIQIVVYAGAIMVLFLFVITLLNPGREEDDDRLQGQRPLAVALRLGLLAEIALLFRSEAVRSALAPFPPLRPYAELVTVQFNGPAPEIGNIQAVGFELFSAYLLPFEVISLVLL